MLGSGWAATTWFLIQHTRVKLRTQKKRKEADPRGTGTQMDRNLYAFTDPILSEHVDWTKCHTVNELSLN